jgi:hypothetical protein
LLHNATGKDLLSDSTVGRLLKKMGFSQKQVVGAIWNQTSD